MLVFVYWIFFYYFIHSPCYYAIGDAVKYITKKRSLKPKYVKNFSDSRAALQALDSYDIPSSTTLNTIQKLNALGTNTKRLTLNWIKAHNGHEGNEIADRLANMGARAKSKHAHVPISDLSLIHI